MWHFDVTLRAVELGRFVGRVDQKRQDAGNRPQYTAAGHILVFAIFWHVRRAVLGRDIARFALTQTPVADKIGLRGDNFIVLLGFLLGGRGLLLLFLLLFLFILLLRFPTFIGC